MRLIRDEDNTLKLSKIKNGFSITHSYETEFTDRGGRKDMDYHCEEYAFPNLDEAMEKMKELAVGIYED